METKITHNREAAEILLQNLYHKTIRLDKEIYQQMEGSEEAQHLMPSIIGSWIKQIDAMALLLSQDKQNTK